MRRLGGELRMGEKHERTQKIVDGTTATP